MLILTVIEKYGRCQKLNVSIGKRIRQYREEQRMTQEKLAEKTNLSVTYIGMIERGERLPRLDKFIEIANALGVSSELLLADVLVTGYKVKISKIAEQLEKLPEEERTRIYEVVETMIKHGQKKS
jgi:transcriptional regulator with XRE-family HTH domain